MNLAAYELACLGFRVFAIKANAKTPLRRGWQKEATNVPELAAELIPEGCGPGVLMGELSPGVYAVALDVDPAKGGRESLAALGPIGETLTFETASGGLHLIFWTDKPLGNSVGKLGPGLDTRGIGGYLVAPGHVIGGKQYRIKLHRELGRLPLHIEERLTAAPERPTGPKTPVAEDVVADLIQARAIAATWPEAQEGERNKACFDLAARIFDFKVTVATGLDLVAEWNAGNPAPLGDDEVARTVHSAATTRQDAHGRDSTERADAAFDVIAPVAPKGIIKFPRDVSLPAIIARQSLDLVRGLVAPGILSILYGAPAAGKTFMALNMAWAIAMGKAMWAGRRLRRVPVLYVGLEGHDGLDKRTVAHTLEYGDPGDYFARITVPVSLIRGDLGEQGVALIKEAMRQLEERCGEPVGLVIVDTLARAMAGENENDAEAMMAFVEHRVGKLQHDTGAAVLVVHHSNKNGDMRGSSSLLGAAEVVLRCEKDKSGRRSLFAEKVKDGEEGHQFDYSLKVIQLGDDADGEPVTSAVVHIEAAQRRRTCEGRVLEILTAAVTAGQHVSPSEHAGNYAAKVVFDAQAPSSFTIDEIKAAVKYLLPIHFDTVEYLDSGRKFRKRLELRGQDT